MLGVLDLAAPRAARILRWHTLAGAAAGRVWVQAGGVVAPVAGVWSAAAGPGADVLRR